MMANDNTRAAHELLVKFATDPLVTDYLARLEAMQRTSEEDGWWNTDLGLAVEETWGHLKIAIERGRRR
jgi:hypothetical protein